MLLPQGLLRRALITVAAAAVVLPLAGCFATQQDLEPIRSDIAVLEKQFMDVQKSYARAKYAPGDERAVSQEAGDRISDAFTRLSAMEKRLDALETRIMEMKSSQPVVAPQPMAPEPVVIEPIGGDAGAGTAPEPVAPQPTGAMVAAEQMFNEAMAQYKAGDNAKAAASFEALLAAYPKDRYSDDARFWLGETYFARGDYASAAREYERLLEEYPQADRVPDALYSAGLAYGQLNDPAKARQALTRVMDNYPYSDAARKARQKLDSQK